LKRFQFIFILPRFYALKSVNESRVDEEEKKDFYGS
jgi:hypothetical protein